MTQGNLVFDNCGATYLFPISEGAGDWYCCMDISGGDLYEAQEIYERDGKVRGTVLYLMKYPEGERFQPLPEENGVCLGRPVMADGKIYILSVDFPKGLIKINSFSCDDHSVETEAEIGLREVEDCYNLMLHGGTVTLSRQPNDGSFQLLWPERITIPIGSRETFYYRDGDELYFSRWFEDPDYREETVVRDVRSGKIMAVFPGEMAVMPGGEKWFIK